MRALAARAHDFSERMIVIIPKLLKGKRTPKMLSQKYSKFTRKLFSLIEFNDTSFTPARLVMARPQELIRVQSRFALNCWTCGSDFDMLSFIGSDSVIFELKTFSPMPLKRFDVGTCAQVPLKWRQPVETIRFFHHLIG